MKTKLFFAVAVIIIIGCSDSDSKNPISKSHPAYNFYKIAASGITSVVGCEYYGGKEISLNKYIITEIISQGIFIIKQNSTGKEFIAVSFGESLLGETLVVVNTCCWEIK